jgi:hypothetical protein
MATRTPRAPPDRPQILDCPLQDLCRYFLVGLQYAMFTPRGCCTASICRIEDPLH